MTTIDSAKQKKWDHRFMQLCEHISNWTEDRDFKVGCVVVGSALEIRATGHNGFPRGVSAQESDRFNRTSGEKFFWMEHAERNAIYNATRTGVSLQDCTIYINRFPCSDCCRAIIQSGITRVCCPEVPEFDGALDHSFSVSEIMLSEADIIVTTYTL